MSYLRTLGSFVYSTILASLFFLVSTFIYIRILVYASGIWQTVGCIIGMIILLGWLSERGVEICSIPFNFIWDNTTKTRIATILPAVLIGLWCISAPFRISLTFSVGDWIVSIIWMVCDMAFYYNLLMLPLINADMGVQCHRKKMYQGGQTTRKEDATMYSDIRANHSSVKEFIGDVKSKYTSGLIKIRNSDGTETRGRLTGYVDEDGKHEYYVEGDLKQLHYATDSELDSILLEYRPDEQ